MNARCEGACAAVLAEASNRSLARSADLNGAPDLPGAMLVSSAWPAALATVTFPPVGARCPHGVVFWAYPDANLIEALTQINEGRYRAAPAGGNDRG